jgi:16S rRNA (cytosine967-C5)-methyltransferase
VVLKSAPSSARSATAQALYKIVHEGQSLTRSTRSLAERIDDPRDRAFAQSCIYGVLRHYYSLQALLDQLLKKPLRRKDADIEALLLSGLYQIKLMNVPAHAAVSSNVEAARSLNKSWACGLVNAVLRKASAQPLTLERDRTTHFEHPSWLVERLQVDYPDDWESILNANNEHPPMTLRVNRLQSSRADYLAALGDTNLPAEPTRFSDDGVLLTHSSPVAQLPGFEQGLFSVQDEAAQLATGLLELEPGQRVLDACAAPGGKTTHILERVENAVELLALDLDAGRLEDVKANFARLGLSCSTLAADATDIDTWWDGKYFDRILLDAPCSASGIIRRHPDIRFHRSPEDIAELADRQRKLLASMWSVLAPGGTLLYVTCSVFPAENDAVIAHLAEATADASVDILDIAWARRTKFGCQILPGDHGMDGFYYARLSKGHPAI